MKVWWDPEDAKDWLDRLETRPLEALMSDAEALTLAGHGAVVTYSRKVFIPLTQLCRDVCHYCTFARRPSELASPYLELDEVLAIARAGELAGCREALFTLGDRPEARYATARNWLAERGYASTLDYVAAAARLVLDETSLLPHLNPGLMDAADYSALRPLAASMGLMLESTSKRLCEKGMPHHGSPDKDPQARLESIRLAGEAKVPFTTGLLIGIGETRAERVEALLAIRDLHARYGHIQEVIIQNFRAKPDTLMRNSGDPSLRDHLWTIAAARLILGPEMTIQAPPNLQPGELRQLVRAGVNDWGGVSPVTPDHVNPEAPWPHLMKLETETEAAGRHLRQRLAIGPAFARNVDCWADPALHTRIRRAVDARGLPREVDWYPGTGAPVPELLPSLVTGRDPQIAVTLGLVSQGEELTQRQVARLFTAEGRDFDAVCRVADELRADRVGDAVTHVINRNINYTNICLYRCGFCAFSKGSTKSERGPAYNIDHAEIARRVIEARDRGATEVCLQGGIHPSYDGNTYRGIVAAVKAAVPEMHVHAFSPLEVHHGATTLGLSYVDYLTGLKQAGLATLPGTAAEILSDDIRQIICPDKIMTGEWLAVMRAAHKVGLKSTATIMFGHVETYDHWAIHLVRLRRLQQETGGFTEFVPLPFVHMEAPNWRKGQTRSGPSWREAVLMHAVARIALDGAIPNIQASWVKLGPDGAAVMLQSGANDLGGVLMDESITRAAGGMNGQLFDVPQMKALARGIGRPLRERSTVYGRPLNQMASAD
ncbi:5-amino-6-(D-ribitylamino)uracil--L-tyrosine 4-hydroxyphenyl transferase CofH [Novosphingobium sp. MW5]|nr:5-amino-6-(D-ribitylamino)uracil--L-tyrosine 4-hydroxyphenyl transferase CofH [Novosphingobium sp. MW5]